MTVLVILLSVLAAGVAFVLFGGLVIAYLSTHPPRKRFKRTPEQIGAEFEEVEFLSRDDDIILRGWLLPHEKPCGAVIFCHGMLSNRSAMLDWAKALREEGFITLLFDFRAFGKSDGNRSTGGHLEKLDLLGAIDYLSQREDTKGLPLGVFGFSMGGATAILTAASDLRVGAVATHGAFATLERAIVQRCRHHFGLLSPLAQGGMTLFGKYFHWYAVSPEKIAPLNAVAQLSPRPLLILHGELDPVVPPADAMDLSTAAGYSANVHILKASGHSKIAPEIREEARQIVARFFAKSLCRTEARVPEIQAVILEAEKAEVETSF